MQLLKIILRSINQNNPLSAVNYELLFRGGTAGYLYKEEKKETRSTNPRKGASVISISKAVITIP